MSINFLDHIKDIEASRIPGMVLYPLDEVLFTVLIGLLCHEETTGGQVGTIRTADAAWLAKRHPQWAELKSILSVTTQRTTKKTGKTSTETRLYITSLPPDPARLARAVRAHWSIENNLHWTLDVTFREDQCRVRKDHAARNLAMIRRAVLNMPRRETSKILLKRKRLKAAANHEF